MASISGLDLSSVQGLITAKEWDNIASSGTRFIVAKCGEGNKNIPDPDFIWNIESAKSHGLIVGAYMFPYALPNDPRHPGRSPEQQASMHFDQCSELGTKAGDLPCTLDCEWPRPEQWGKPIPGIDSSVVDAEFLRDWFSAYLEHYEKLQGYPMIVYGDPWFLKNLKPPPEWARNPLWEAAYDLEAPAIYPWAGWTIRQTSGGGGRLPNGCPVDTDVIVDEATLASLLSR